MRQVTEPLAVLAGCPAAKLVGSGVAVCITREPTRTHVKPLRDREARSAAHLHRDAIASRMRVVPLVPRARSHQCGRFAAGQQTARAFAQNPAEHNCGVDTRLAAPRFTNRGEPPLASSGLTLPTGVSLRDT